MYSLITEYIRERVTVPDEALEKAFSYGRVAHYKKGDLILRAGEYCRFIGFLNSGLVMVSLADGDGEEVICHFCFSKEFFTYVEGISSMIPSHKNFIAVEDCELLLLNKSDLPLVFAIHPAFEALFNRVILEDLYRMHAVAEEKRIRTVEERYVQLMAAHPELLDRVPLKFIASYLGVAAPSLSRMRKRLSKRN